MAMADAEALKARGEEMKVAWRAGDLDTLMGMYAEDASYAGNSGEIKKGKAEIRKIAAQYLDKYASADWDSIDTAICGDVCTDMGYFRMTRKGCGTVDKGKYIAGLVKKDGKWYMRFDTVFFS